MKTMVMGLFDQVDDARRVLAHLASLPLDLDAIQIVHADPDVQRQLAAEAKLPPRRAPRNGLILGAGLGAALGFMVGDPSLGGDLPVISALGPLLTMAAATLGGAIAGAIAGTMAESLRLPPEHQSEVVEALQAGATVVVVQTENQPTARALGDLFRDNGSRQLAPAAPATVAAPTGASIDTPLAAPSTSTRTRLLSAGGPGAAVGPPAAPAPVTVPDEYLAFAPPWRRPDGEIEPPGGHPAADDTPPDTPEIDMPTAAALADDPGAVAAPEGDSHSPSHVTIDDVPLPPPDVTVDALGLPARTARLLREAGITGLAELRTLVDRDPGVILDIHGIGPAALAEIRRVVVEAAPAGVAPAEAAPTWS